MRLICFLAAIAVLFCLSDASAGQPAYAATVAAADMPDSPSAQAAGLRMLTWPGKVETAPRARTRPAARTWPSQSYSSTPLRSADARPLAAAPPPAMRRIWDPSPRPPETPADRPTQVAALPTSIYAPPPPRAVAAAPIAPAAAPQAPVAPRTVTQTAANDTSDYQPPHFYSLHRQYGQAPDPIPLDAQFFNSASPDLAQPPPPVPRTVTTSTGRVIQATPPSPDDVPG